MPIKYFFSSTFIPIRKIAPPIANTLNIQYIKKFPSVLFCKNDIP